MAFTGEVDSLQPENEKLNKRASYFEMLSSISTELDLMLNDLKKKETFSQTSPRSPLSPSHVSFETKDRSSLKSIKRQSSYSDTDEGFSSGLSSTATSKYTFTPVSPASTIQPQGPESSTHNSAGFNSSFVHSLHDDTLTMMTRLVHTKPIWYLPCTQRAAAAHYLQGQPVGTFVVRQARQKDKLSLTLKHPGTGKGPYIESYPIESTLQGVKLSIEDMMFPVLDDLIAYHIQTQVGLPCRLALPMAVLAARNLREIQSLALLEEDFWKSSHCKHQTLPTQHDSLMNLSQEWVETPTYSKPLLSQSQSGASFMNKQSHQLHLTPMKPVEDGLKNMPDVCGMYGVITTPQIIYENANTNQKPDPKRPDMLDSSTQNLYADRRSSANLTPGHQRPPSEFDRQDMRFSSASEFEYATSTSEQRYPPPKCAPPPPPRAEESLNVFMMPSVPARYTWSLVKPSSEIVEYSLPHDELHLPPKHKSLSTCEEPNLQSVNHDGYRIPASEAVTKDVYKAPQSSINSLFTQQQPCLPHKQSNYRAPPPPASCRQSKSCADSQQPAAAPRAEEQIQNILQPVITCSSSTKQESAVCHTLPEFDPLFNSTTENKRLHRNTSIASESHTLMRDFALNDVQSGIKTLTDTTQSNNNNRLLNLMAPMSHFTERTTCEISQLVRVHDVEPEQDTLSDHEMEGNENRNSLDNSSQSDFEVTLPSSAGVPFTENENGNHLLLSQSLEFGDTTEENKVDQPREGDKKDYKRNKSGLSNFDKLKVLAIKGSRGATKKLHRIRVSGKSKKRDASTDIQEAILSVAANTSIGLGALVNGFIRTQEEKCESDKPDIVLRSIRQFMSGTKNYLLNKREPEIDVAIDRHMDEMDLARLEGIVEGALHQCVLAPLKSDIGMSCINEYNRNGSMALMDHNIMQAKTKTPEELGIKSKYMPPEGEDLEGIRQLFSQLQEAYSPLNKLDLLLKIVTAIYKSVRDRGTGREVTNSMGADDFLPMLIYVLVKCEMISIEIEADYMWGLLDPSMLSGEGGYYLTTLSSAICVLKQFEEDTNTDTQGFLTVLAIVSQDSTCISLKTLPVLPGMMASEVCSILAQRLGIRDAEDYRLYLLRDSIEIPVEDFDCPLRIKNDVETDGSRGCRFGFRPIHTEVSWPRTSGLVE